MSLAEMMSADADFVLSDVAAEDAIYYPAAGGQRTISVVVMRQAEEMNAPLRQTEQPLVVFAKNDPTAGVSSAEISNRDRIRVARTKGGEHRVLQIQRMSDHNPGWVELECL